MGMTTRPPSFYIIIKLLFITFSSVILLKWGPVEALNFLPIFTADLDTKIEPFCYAKSVLSGHAKSCFRMKFYFDVYCLFHFWLK